MIVSLRSSLYNPETTVFIFVHCDLLRSSLYDLESTKSTFALRLGRPEGKANADSFIARYVSARCLRIYVILHLQFYTTHSHVDGVGACVSCAVQHITFQVSSVRYSHMLARIGPDVHRGYLVPMAA